jgi:hypothetical protein
LNFATSNVGGANVEMQYSLTNDATFPANVTNVSNNLLNSDALFTNTGANDFSLKSTSPAIDAGNPSSSGLNIPVTDILGNPRIDNTIIDIGAIEFQQDLNVNNINELADLKIYHNPTKDFIYITSNESLTIEVFSIDGKSIGNYNTKIIDLSKVKSGIYILKIEDSTGKSIIRKIVKK